MKNMTKSPSRFVVYFSEYISFNRQTISSVDTKGAHYYSAWQEFWKVTAISNVCRDVKWRLYALIIILTCLTGSNKLTTKHKRFFYDKLKEQEVELHAIQGYVLKNYLTNATKGQLISEWFFLSSNLPKSQPNFSHISTLWSYLGQKSAKYLVGFLGDLKTLKIHSEINWPLGTAF